MLSFVLLASYFMPTRSIVYDILRNYVTSLILRCDIVLTTNVDTVYIITHMLTANRPQTEMLQAKYTAYLRKSAHLSSHLNCNNSIQ
jgi:hypothetical protein